MLKGSRQKVWKLLQAWLSISIEPPPHTKKKSLGETLRPFLRMNWILQQKSPEGDASYIHQVVSIVNNQISCISSTGTPDALTVSRFLCSSENEVEDVFEAARKIISGELKKE